MMPLGKCAFDSRGHLKLLRAELVFVAEPSGDDAFFTEDVHQHGRHSLGIVTDSWLCVAGELARRSALQSGEQTRRLHGDVAKRFLKNLRNPNQVRVIKPEQNMNDALVAEFDPQTIQRLLFAPATSPEIF